MKSRKLKFRTTKEKSKIVKKCVLHDPQTKRRLLCMKEKLEIAAYKEHSLLNKRKKSYRNINTS